jgi:hypothetical protein
MEIKIKKQLISKSYLKNFLFFEFDNLLDLLFELFSNNELINKGIEDTIYNKIIDLGYENIYQIPPEVKKKLEKRFYQLLNRFERNFDLEKHTYLFMAKVVEGAILVTINDELIETFTNPIRLKIDSVISFTEIKKIDNITFTTL